MNICFQFLWVYAQECIDGSYGISYFQPHCFLSGCTILQPYQQYTRVPISSHPHQCLSFTLFYSSHPSKFKVVPVFVKISFFFISPPSLSPLPPPPLHLSTYSLLLSLSLSFFSPPPSLLLFSSSFINRSICKTDICRAALKKWGWETYSPPALPLTSPPYS